MTFVVNLVPLPEPPMIGRVGDPRIGYFYNNYRVETQSMLTGNPLVLINRKNLEKSPWVYIIADSIPPQYHPSIKRGILY